MNSSRSAVSPMQTLLGLVGLALSAYALYLHLQIHHSRAPLSCDINDTLSCSKVIGGTYGELFSIPLGAWGMGYFGVVLAIALLPLYAKVSAQDLAAYRRPVAWAGIAGAACLAGLSYGVLHAVCAVCSSVHVTCLALGVHALWLDRRARLSPSPGEDDGSFLKLVFVSLVAMVSALLLGLLSPAFGPALFPAPRPIAKSEKKPFPADWLMVSRSNYVGGGEDYRVGDDDAPVVIQMFSDLRCPLCKLASANLREALTQVGPHTAQIVFRNYPLNNVCNPKLSSEGHKFSCDLAVAARCAGAQGKFLNFKDWAFEHLEASPSEAETLFSRSGLSGAASQLGLNVQSFTHCLDSKAELDKIRSDIALGDRLNIQGTPLILLAGVPYEGGVRTADLVEAMQGALRDLSAASAEPKG